MLRVICPFCDTSYAAARCGVPVVDKMTARISCPVCQTEFDAAVSSITTDAIVTRDWLWRKHTTPATTAFMITTTRPSVR
mgnify:CR=1 FL=1